jgi:ribonuclease BN (tRNA processing enzyme)
VFTGDTGPNPAFWQRISEIPVSLLVIETAFSSRKSELAEASQHRSPRALAFELQSIAEGRSNPIYLTHTKPAETELIMSAIRDLDRRRPASGRRAHDIRWLQAGQELEL